MRHLFIQVPGGSGARVMDLAEKHNGSNPLLLKGDGPDGKEDLVQVSLSNAVVEAFVAELQQIDGLRITFMPQGALPLRPPADDAPDRLTDVTPRSPLEIILGGVQSIGSWKGFLGYAAAAGVVVWIGLATNTIYLLVAAMLIAPFAGPAMNTALGTARGDLVLIRRSVLRYGGALLLTAVVSFILMVVFGRGGLTNLMVAQSNVSITAVLLPLVAGAAGALNLAQSDRNSLVSGAATGVLVAASLAPPTGLIGIAFALGEWGLLKTGVFLIALQLAGINFSGALVFRLYGVRHDGVRFQRGKASVFPASVAFSAVALAALLTWQFWSTPDLQRTSRSQAALSSVRKAVGGVDGAVLVEADVRFTRSNVKGQNTLLATVYVQREGGRAPADSLRATLTRRIQTQLLEEDYNVLPLVSVMLLDPPPGK